MDTRARKKAAKEKKRKEKRRREKAAESIGLALDQLEFDLNQAIRLKEQGRMVEIARRILNLKEFHPKGCRVLADHYWRNGDPGSAYVYLKRLTSRPNPLPLDLYSLGNFHFQRERHEESLDAFGKFLEMVKSSGEKELRSFAGAARQKMRLLKELIKKKPKLPLFPEGGKQEKDSFPPPSPRKTSAETRVKREKDRESKPAPLPIPNPRSAIQNSNAFPLPAPASPPPPPQEIETIVEIKGDDFFKFFPSLSPDTCLSYRQRLEFYHLTLLKNYDELLCLDSLRNVEKFWYQIETVKKILRDFNGRVLLADEVGLGKTIEACMGIKEFLVRGLAKRVLILTPPSLVSQWKEEIASKFGLDFITTDEENPAKNPSFWKENSLIIASISLAKSKSNFDPITAVDYDLVVVDEAHHMKNRQTLSWKLVNSLKKKFIFMLSATPVQNNLIELFNLITLLKPGALQTEFDFKKKYMQRGNPRLPQNKETLKTLLREVMIRNTRSLIDIKLPKRFAATVTVHPSDAEKAIYDKISDFVGKWHREKKTGNKMLMTTLLREAGSSPFALRDTLAKYDDPDLVGALELIRGLEETEKGNALLRLIQKEEGKKIVFTQFKGTLDYLSGLLSRSRVPFSVFHGGLDSQRKNQAIESFREELPVLLTTESGGEGRNIQFANTLINFDLPWNPMKIEQRVGRIHRIGQTKDVFIFNLCQKESIEDQILEVLDKKINMFELVIGEIDGILGHIEEDAEFSDIVFDLWAGAANREEAKKSFNELGERMVSAQRAYQETKILDQELFEEDFIT